MSDSSLFAAKVADLIAIAGIIVRSNSLLVALVTGYVAGIGIIVIDYGSNSLFTALVTISVAAVRPKVIGIDSSSGESASVGITYCIASVGKYVGSNSGLTASVTVIIASARIHVRSNSEIITNIAGAVAIIGVNMASYVSDGAAKVTRVVAIVIIEMIYGSGIVAVLIVTIGVASIIENVAGNVTSESAGVADGIAIVSIVMRSNSYLSALVTVGVALAGVVMLGFSCYVALSAIGVAIVLEEVRSLSLFKADVTINIAVIVVNAFIVIPGSYENGIVNDDLVKIPFLSFIGPGCEYVTVLIGILRNLNLFSYGNLNLFVGHSVVVLEGYRYLPERAGGEAKSRESKAEC